MAVHLYGNVNGTYQKPNIDLFEMTGKQNNQPVKFCDTEAGKNVPAIKVNISEEGLRALHGSKIKGSVDIQKQTALPFAFVYPHYLLSCYHVKHASPPLKY